MDGPCAVNLRIRSILTQEQLLELLQLEDLLRIFRVEVLGVSDVCDDRLVMRQSHDDSKSNQQDSQELKWTNIGYKCINISHRLDEFVFGTNSPSMSWNYRAGNDIDTLIALNERLLPRLVLFSTINRFINGLKLVLRKHRQRLNVCRASCRKAFLHMPTLTVVGFIAHLLPPFTSSLAYLLFIDFQTCFFFFLSVHLEYASLTL